MGKGSNAAFGAKCKPHTVWTRKRARGEGASRSVEKPDTASRDKSPFCFADPVMPSQFQSLYCTCFCGVLPPITLSSGSRASARVEGPAVLPDATKPNHPNNALISNGLTLEAHNPYSASGPSTRPDTSSRGRELLPNRFGRAPIITWTRFGDHRSFPKSGLPLPVITSISTASPSPVH